MEHEDYNPSPLEVQFANAIEQLSDQLAKQLPEHKILSIEKNIRLDNPQLNVRLENQQGKRNEVVIRIIQRVDHELGDI